MRSPAALLGAVGLVLSLAGCGSGSSTSFAAPLRADAGMNLNYATIG